MKIAMTKTSIRLALNAQERDVYVQKFGDNAPVTFEWYDQGRIFLVRKQKLGEPSCTLYRKGKDKDGWDLSWPRVARTTDHSRLPVFGTCPVEGYTYVDKGLRVVVPPEHLRPQPVRFVRTKKNGHPPAAAPSAAPVTVVDLLDRLRHHRDKLNELRARHPENITFKVRSDGALGFEFLADE